MEERVMHIPREAVEGLSGYEPEVEPYRLLGEVEPDFHREDLVEGWDHRVEVVAYTLVTRGFGEMLVGDRLYEAGESRLQGQSFLGWGGHFNTKDAWWAGEEGDIDWEMTINRGAFREASEELTWVSHGWPQGHFHGRGFVYSEADDVSTDHVGVVSLLRVADVDVEETDKYHGSWAGAARLSEVRNFEEWSELIAPVVSEILQPKLQW